jgi:hypothetical protein
MKINTFLEIIIGDTQTDIQDGDLVSNTPLFKESRLTPEIFDSKLSQ